MQHNSQIFVNDCEYEVPSSPNSPPETVPPRKQPSSTRSKSFQDRPREPEFNRDYETVPGTAFLQMPSPHHSRPSVNGQRSNSCVDAIPYPGDDRMRDRSKTPERSEKKDMTRTPDRSGQDHRRDRTRTPERPERPERKDKPKTPDSQRMNRPKTPDSQRRDRAKTPERRERAKTPERTRRARSRTPDRSRSPDSLSGRHPQTERRRTPPDVPRPPDPTVPPFPPALSDRVVNDDHGPLTHLHQPTPLTSTATEDTAKESDQSKRSGSGEEQVIAAPTSRSGTKNSDMGKEFDTYHSSRTSGSGKRRHYDDIYQNGSRARDGHERQRAYSDSEAENYQDPVYGGGRRCPSSPLKHRNSDRRKPPPPPIVYKSEIPDRYYKIPCRIPYYTRPQDSQDDSDYDNIHHRPASKPDRNGALLIPAPPARPRDHDFRPYPARFAPVDPLCPYQSETTENEYLTPAEQAAANSRTKHKRSHSDSSSSRTLLSPWTKSNKILTPKYPLLSTRNETVTSQDPNRTLENASKHLHKLKCSASSNNVWHDPLLGVDKRDIAYSGDVHSDKSKDKRPLESFAEFSTDVTMNYMRFIWNSPELIRKCIWSVLFLGFFIYSFLCCWRSFATYFDMPTSTKYNMYFEPNKLLRFPSITICNMNPHNKDYLDKDENKAMKAYLAEEMPVPWTKDVSEPSSKEFENFNVKRYYRQSGQKIDEFIENVTFFERKETATDAFREQFTTHGLCWTFNADGKKNVNRTGMDFGLSFALNINQSIYPDFVTTAGVKVMFHNNYEPALIDEYGMALTPGTENFISLNYERIRNLKAPYGNCRDDAMPIYKNYSISGCEGQCFTEVMVEQCGCRSYYLKAVPGRNDVECNLAQEKNCVARLIKRYHAGEFASYPVCQCADPCTAENYVATLSTAEYPAKNYGEALEKYNNNKTSPTRGEPRNVQFYRENFLKVHIYFEILSIKEVEKVGSYKWSNLMGDVGGQLGLFLGANIVTIFEFVDFYLRLIWYNIIMKYVVKYSIKGNHNHHHP